MISKLLLLPGGSGAVRTTQQYLGRLPDADDRALAAFEAIRGRGK